MEKVHNQCMLTVEQRSVIIRGIREGKKETEESMKYLPITATRTYPPRLLYDMINTHIVNLIKANPHMQLNVVVKKAGFHPYIVIHDMVRNIFILVSKLPQNKYIYNASRYRGDFASMNYDRLFAMGATIEEIASGVEYQPSLLIGDETLPFGIIVSYDAQNDVVFEGALRPDQEDWIYKETITKSVLNDTHNIVPIVVYDQSKINLELKKTEEDEHIVIKLKDN